MHKISLAMKLLAAVFVFLVISNPAMAFEKPEIFVQRGKSSGKQKRQPDTYQASESIFLDFFHREMPGMEGHRY